MEACLELLDRKVMGQRGKLPLTRAFNRLIGLGLSSERLGPSIGPRLTFLFTRSGTRGLLAILFGGARSALCRLARFARSTASSLAALRASTCFCRRARSSARFFACAPVLARRRARAAARARSRFCCSASARCSCGALSSSFHAFRVRSRARSACSIANCCDAISSGRNRL